MNQYNSLSKQAIDLAKQANWQSARDINQQILDLRPDDIAALNRLAFCYLQLDDPTKAKKLYSKVLEIEKLNPIARKYLDLIKQNVKIKPQPAKRFDDFVEEPRKTKIVGLDRLADPKVLHSLSVASECILKPKGRYVCVLTEDGDYVGSLPEDISLHLSKLIKTGNVYLCLIKSASKTAVSVFIKEKEVSEENRHIPSFLTQSRADIETDEDVVLTEALDLEDESTTDEKTEESTDDDSDNDSEDLPADVVGSMMR